MTLKPSEQKQHQQEIMCLQQAFQEQVIKMDNLLNTLVTERTNEVLNLHKVATTEQHILSLPSFSSSRIHPGM